MTSDDLQALRHTIGPKVRDLRTQRRWTLAELAARIGMSPARLSEVERQQGSFSAEQLLIMLRLFQVGPEHFLPTVPGEDDASGSLLNALVTHGATHLVPDERFVVHTPHLRPEDAIVAVLTRHPTARFLTAVPVVIVRQVDVLQFPAIQEALHRSGVAHRWGWMLQHTCEALDAMDDRTASVRWHRQARRAATVARLSLERLEPPRQDAPFDMIDQDLRTQASVVAAESRTSEADEAWRVLSRLSRGDFVGPLEVVSDAV